MNSLTVKNFRGLKNVKIPLSSFVCIIGENNSGKSSLLLALYYFLKGKPISDKYFFDKSKPIKIELEISEITEEDLLRLKEEHRTKLIKEIEDDALKLVRKYNGGKNELLVKKLVPIDERFDDKVIKDVLSGKRGGNVQKAMEEHLPEFADHFDGISTHDPAKEIVASIIKEMDESLKVEKEKSLPSGIPNSITALLPEPIYISAVKNLTDDAKTSSSATFGKIIKVLLDLIDEEEIKEVVDSLNKIDKYFNKIKNEDGTESEEDRLEKLKQLERISNDFLDDNFPNTSLEINVSPPDIEDLFSSSTVLIDDGVKGDIETKGDGLKRAVIFTLLRTYNEIKETSTTHRKPYIFLFEEPELYLHPASQKILFEALCNLAKDDSPVITTTHSPIFFTLDHTGTFVKMKRIDATAPYCEPFFVDIKEDLDKYDLIRIISFENNNAAFFSRKVLFVEGDSDLQFIKHISKILNEEWDFDTKNIPIIVIHGKGNALKYKEFFESFEIEVHMLFDLDIIVKDFHQLDVPKEIKEQRTALMEEVTKIAESEGIDGSPSRRRDVERVTSRHSVLEKYMKVKEIVETAYSSRFIDGEEAKIFMEFSSHIFSIERDKVLKLIIHSDEYDLEMKDVLISSLREQNIYVLSKGELEDYYPEEIEGKNKWEKAVKACELLLTKDHILEVCPIIPGYDKTELEFIFEKIFT